MRRYDKLADAIFGVMAEDAKVADACPGAAAGAVSSSASAAARLDLRRQS